MRDNNYNFKKEILSASITFLLIIVVGLAFINMVNYYKTEISDLEFNLNKTNQARIRAENKPCCQLIQERYIDTKISEDGLSFIYEEHPQIISCNDSIDYQGGESWEMK